MLPYPGEYVKKQKYYNFKKITIANFLKMCNNIKCKINRGVAQFGRAPRSGRGGRKFKSCHLDQKSALREISLNAFLFAKIWLKY